MVVLDVMKMHGLRFIVVYQRRETDDVMVSQSSSIPLNLHQLDFGSNSLKKMEDLRIYRTKPCMSLKIMLYLLTIVI